MEVGLQMRPVPGFDGYYVTSDGKVWSTRGRGAHAKPYQGGRWLKGYTRKDGYVLVNLAPRRVFREVHTLVALAFLGPRPEGQQVRHLNGEPGDNRLTNLKYGTVSENQMDRVRHGRHYNASKTHCVNDHEFTPENTFVRKGTGHRDCRSCMAKQRKKGGT